ncbi:MAG: 3-hydroxybutyryl-CoA dehydrogenase [Dehalococcoidia bacterium]|nr:3-hydroxybutyryl-CoA dehydrogenase [Dehalococcoidia bacterium]
MAIQKVGVIGCGLMGSGIAEVCARSGYDILVSEVNQKFLDKGLAAINASLTRAAEKGKISATDKDAALSRIKGIVGLDSLTDRDLVIEVVIENMDEKKRIFSTLDKVCPPHTILASNTSCLSITEMAVCTKRPDKVLGMHFFNPVPVMKPVEIVTTILTSQETLATARSVAKQLGKEVVVAKDTPGFIVNRLLIPYLLDAIKLYQDGVATREDLDASMVLGLNHPMGPLTLSDFIGLDTLLFIADAMYEEFKNPAFAAPPLLRKMILAGWLGRKSGKGFYEYKK